MGTNQELGQAVFNMMAGVLLKEDPSFNFMCDGDTEQAAMLAEEMGRTDIDETHKVRHNYGEFIGYGYDFRETDEGGNPAKEIYENAVENTRKLMGSPNIEQLVHDKVVDEHFGVYLTKL